MPAVMSLYAHMTAHRLPTLPEAQLNVSPSQFPRNHPELPTAIPIPPSRRGNVMRGEGNQNGNRKESGTSLVVQWIGLHLPVQGIQVQSLNEERRIPLAW